MATAEKPIVSPELAPALLSEKSDDRFTLARLMLLITGLGIGTPLFLPKMDAADLMDSGFWRLAANAVLVGLALPAPIICMQRALRAGRLGPGGMFALAAGLGVALLLPPAIADWQTRLTGKGSEQMAATCLNFSLPVMGLWYLLAAIFSGHVGRQTLRRRAPWTEKYGLLLALLWSPLGVWLLYDVYQDAFK